MKPKKKKHSIEKLLSTYFDFLTLLELEDLIQPYSRYFILNMISEEELILLRNT